MGRNSISAGAAIFLAILAVGGAGAAPPLSVYGNLPGFERAALSPSGNGIAIIGRVGEHRRLIILDKDRKPVNASVIPDDTKVRDLLWAGEDSVLIKISATVNLGGGFTIDRAELFSMLVLPATGGGKAWGVFQQQSAIQGGVAGFYGVNQHDGRWYGYFGGMTADHNSATDAVLDNTNPILYEVDLQTHKSRKIADRSDDPETYRDWLVGTDGKVRATLDFSSSNGKWRISTKSAGRVASGTQPLGGINLVGFGSTPDTFVYSEDDRESGETSWSEVPMAGGPAKKILADQYIGGSYFDVRSHQLIGYRAEGDMPTYSFFDAHQTKVVAAAQKAFAGSRVSLIDWNDKFDRLIITVDGKTDPQSWWLVDINTGHANQLGTSYPIDDADIGAVRMVRYKASDGTEIAGVLTLPPGKAERGLPVIIMPHGGPAARNYPEFDWWAQAFASRGYAVLQPNFRGSTGYGTAFERAGHGEWGRKMQTDLSDGLAYLAKEGIVDPKRACIVGASYGGYAALAGVTMQQGLYRCAVSVAGVSDVGKMVTTDIVESGDNRTMQRGLKEEVGSGRDLSLVSPVKFAARADAPILLIHGKDDTVVAYDQSNDMAAALRRAGKPVEFVTLAQTDHWLTKGSTRLAMLEAAVAFVEKNNPEGGK